MNKGIITLYTNGTTVQAPASVLYNPFPDEDADDAPESGDVETGLDNDNTTHSDDWDNDEEDE